MLADELPAGSADRAARRGVVGAGGPRRVALAELQRAAAGTVSKIRGRTRSTLWYAPAAFIRHGVLPDPRDLDRRGGERHDWVA